MTAVLNRGKTLVFLMALVLAVALGLALSAPGQAWAADDGRSVGDGGQQAAQFELIATDYAPYVQQTEADPEVYTVEFISNGGAGLISSRQVVAGQPIGELPTATREGFVLAGWWTLPVGGEQITAETIVTASATYYTQWAQAYTAYFVSNGGSSSLTSRQLVAGDPIGELPVVTREGYVFTGWWTLLVGGEQITAETAMNAHAIYYAQWKKIHTVTFSAVGGSASATSVNVVAGDPLGELPTATREGYVFAGWWTSSIGGKQISAETVVSSNATLYAHWTQLKTYVVYFSAVGGSASATSIKVVGGEPIGELPTATRNGYTLTGWWTLPIGGEQVTAGTVIATTKIYFAQWKRA
jgi:uncharacterized repeat protein (TIGR02543 family)